SWRPPCAGQGREDVVSARAWAALQRRRPHYKSVSVTGSKGVHDLRVEVSGRVYAVEVDPRRERCRRLDVDASHLLVADPARARRAHLGPWVVEGERAGRAQGSEGAVATDNGC